jgi:hypothetical protein
MEGNRREGNGRGKEGQIAENRSRRRKIRGLHRVRVLTLYPAMTFLLLV